MDNYSDIIFYGIKRVIERSDIKQKLREAIPRLAGLLEGAKVSNSDLFSMLLSATEGAFLNFYYDELHDLGNRILNRKRGKYQ